MKKLFTILTVLFVATFLSAQGQNVHFSFTDGTHQSYSIEDVQKKSFGAETMDLQLIGGTTYSWPLATIKNFRFSEQVGIGALDEEHLVPMRIFPNPTSGSISIEYSLNQRSPVRMEILDQNGRLCRIIELGDQPSGDKIVTWDGIDAEGRPAMSGTYLCRIVTSQFQISRRFIIQ